MMRMYRLGDGAEANGWPFLFDGNAFLADGTPLTERDEDGRIVPATEALSRLEKDCSGGVLRLADRTTGIEALARALDKGDRVCAPILLVQLQIDQARNLSKYNPFHKPPGPGGGQFASSPWSDSGTYFSSSPLENGDIESVAQTMGVGFNSTYEKGKYGEEIDKVHDLVMMVVASGILEVGSQNFRPGMPEYGRKLHDAVASKINALGLPNLVADPVYHEGNEIPNRIGGSSVPDIYYKSPTGLMVVWELKTGRAVDLQAPGNLEQKERTLRNMRGPLYEYIQVYGK
jgi:hypothetical protein